MAWTKTTKGKDVLFEETVVIADSAGSAATYAFTSAIPNNVADWQNKKITVRLEVTEVSATDGDIDAYIQTSVNGLTAGDTTAPAAVAFPNWANASANLDYTLDTSALSVSSLLADLTDVYAPYMRVYLYTDGADIGDSCSVKVSIAIAAEDTLETADIGGIGVDPS